MNPRKKVGGPTSLAKLLFGITLVTLYFNSSAEDPFNTPKLIALVISSGFMLNNLVSQFLQVRVRKKSTEFKTFLIVVIFLVAMIIAYLATSPKIIGLIGDTQRRNGLITYFSLSIIFLFAFLNVDFNNIYGFFKATIIVGFLSGVYGLIQLTGNDFVPWNNRGAPVITTLGNQNFASALLALTSLISLFSLLTRINMVFKTMAVMNLPLAAIGVIGSDSRQGIVSFLIGLIVFATLVSAIRFAKFRYLIYSTTIVAFSLIVSGMLQSGPLAKFLYKDSISVRGFYWRAGWEMFTNHPITGVGIDLYGAYFKEFRDVSYPLRYGFELTSSNAHNSLIQFFATGGIFVGITYLVLLSYILIRSLKSMNNHVADDQKVLIVLFSTWISFQAQAFISIDNIGLVIWGWTLGGLVLGLSKDQQAEELKPVSKVSRKNLKHELRGQFVMIVILIPSITLSYYLQRVEHDSWSLRGNVQNVNNSNKDFIRFLGNRIIENPFADTTHKLNAAQGFLQIQDQNRAYDIVLNLHAQDSRNLEVLRWLAIYSEETKNYSQALAYRNKITKLDPWNADNYLKIGMIHKNLGNTQESKRMLDLINSFASNDPISNIASEVLG